MHDFLLAKEIIDQILVIVKEKGLENIQSVDVEIGAISLAHDGLAEHAEDISLENLQFGLASIVKNTILEETKFNIQKVEGESWRIANIEV
jgi:Zn finger protein HypA/HybF involved in hydrogenase expression